MAICAAEVVIFLLTIVHWLAPQALPEIGTDASRSRLTTAPKDMSHPTAAWTLQQLRKAMPSDQRYRFILHDRDAIFSTGLDASVACIDLEVIATPCASPKANSHCKRLIGTLRRECLDWIVP